MIGRRLAQGFRQLARCALDRGASIVRPRDAQAAAARFVVGRDRGLSTREQRRLDAWLAADPSHATILARAEAAFHALDDATDDEVLAAMRRHARAHRRADMDGRPARLARKTQPPKPPDT